MPNWKLHRDESPDFRRKCIQCCCFFVVCFFFGSEISQRKPEGVPPLMDYTGTLRPKGVPFWAQGMGKASLFQAKGM